MFLSYTHQKCLFFFLFFGVLVAKAQTDLPVKYSPTGVINAMLTKGDTLIVGGDFGNVGKYTGGGALFSATSDQPDLTLFPKFIGTISQITSDGNGGFYILGNYHRESEPGSTHSIRLEHLLADYSFEPNFSLPVTFASYINHILYHNGMLYIGTSTTGVSINGQTFNQLAALDVTTKQITTWAPAITKTVGTATVTRLIAKDNTLYILGAFNTVGGIAREGAAAIEISTGTIKPWNPRPNWQNFGSYADLIFYKDKIILGGGFSDTNFNKHGCAMVDTVSGQNYRYLCAAYGFPEVDKGALYWGATVVKLALQGDLLLAYSWGTADTRVTAIDLNTVNIYGTATSPPNFFSGMVWKKYFNMIASPAEMVVIGNSLFLMGEYLEKTYITNLPNSAENLEREIKGGAKLSLTNGGLENWFPDPVGPVVNTTEAMAVAGNKIFIGGLFSHVNGFDRKGVYMVNTQTETMLPFNLDVSYAKTGALKLMRDTLFVGGTFDIPSSNSHSVLAFHVNTASRFNWQTTKVGYVATMDANDTHVFIGGSLNEPSGGANRKNLFAINRATGALDSWAPDPSLTVDKLTLFDDKLYVSGSFMTIAGQARNRVASFSTSPTTSPILTNWNPNANNRVSMVFAKNGLIWMGGSFSKIGTLNSNIFAGVDPETGTVVVNPASTLTGSPIYAIATKNCKLFFGGSFNLSNTGNCTRLTVADLNTNALIPSTEFCQTFDTYFGNHVIAAMTMIGNDLYFGGRIEKLNGKMNSSHIARIRFPDSYFTPCTIANCASAVRLASTADDIDGGSYTQKSNLVISATNKVSGSSQVTLQSNSAVLLLPNSAGSSGFIAQPNASGSFKAEIAGCN